jgi:hypothetical protein
LYKRKHEKDICSNKIYSRAMYSQMKKGQGLDLLGVKEDALAILKEVSPSAYEYFLDRIQ